MTEFGIDVSHHNRVDDWHAVRGNNITFAWIKLTESTGFIDNAAGGHADRARDAGIHVGGYHFARDTDVATQVRHFSTQLQARGLTSADSLAPMLDMEVPELRSQANEFVSDFVTRLRAETGLHKILVYANLDWWRNVLRPDEWNDANIRLWIARFNGDPGNPGFAHPQLALHQHSAEGVVPGIPGPVDRDVTLGAHTVASLLTGSGASTPFPQPPGPETHIVQPGETLSGIAIRHHTSVDLLVRLNHIPNRNLIFPGQVLVLH